MNQHVSIKQEHRLATALSLALCGFSACGRSEVIGATPPNQSKATSSADLTEQSSPRSNLAQPNESQSQDTNEVATSIARVEMLRKTLELEWAQLNKQLSTVQALVGVGTAEANALATSFAPPLKPILIREPVFADLSNANTRGDLWRIMLSQADSDACATDEQRTMTALRKLQSTTEQDLSALRIRFETIRGLMPVVEACAARAENEAKLRLQSEQSLLKALNDSNQERERGSAQRLALSEQLRAVSDVCAAIVVIAENGRYHSISETREFVQVIRDLIRDGKTNKRLGESLDLLKDKEKERKDIADKLAGVASNVRGLIQPVAK